MNFVKLALDYGGSDGTIGGGGAGNGNGGAYGGGGGGSSGSGTPGAGSNGAVRIVYGPNRSFPSTNVATPYT